MNRFDYAAYDETASTLQKLLKAKLVEFEAVLNEALPSSPGGRDAHGRAKALVLTKLEEAYMWIGKAIRDDQIARNGAAPLQEERKNG